MQNKIQIGKIRKVALRELWKKEDKDFTKWLEENIEHLNEITDLGLTIIGREEKVGPFKVDLYAEDAYGNKVIIENQLEKTDHDHLGKLLTYLTNLDAKTAIWVTSNPIEQHITAIEWLNQVTPDDISFYLIKLEAIKIEPSELAAPLFTIVEGPTIEAKEIGQEKKEYAKRHMVREEFWSKFLEVVNKRNKFFTNISSSRDNWIGIGIGMAGVNINLVVSKKYARTEIYINRGTQEENKQIFDLLYSQKNKIENDFGGQLIWEKMEDRVTSRIKYQLDGVNIFNYEDWDKMINFMIDGTERMLKAFKEPIIRINR